MVYTDSHTHIYAAEFDHDLDAVMQRAEERGVLNLFLPAIDSGWHEKMLKVAGDHPHLCYPMMGLHPTSVRENWRVELDMVAGYLSAPGKKFHAIGETGIDLYWDSTYEKEQRLALESQFDLAVHHDLPLVIHTRNSIGIVLDMVKERQDPRLRGVFHCFSGNTGQARMAAGLGFMLGIGGVVTYKNSGLQKVVEDTGLEHLLLETDAPWLPPVPHRGRRNEPSYIPLIALKIAELKNIPPETIAEVTTGNAMRLFGLRKR